MSWLTPILKKAKAGPLSLDDVYKVSDKESAEYLSKQSESFQDEVAKYLASGRSLPKPDLKIYLYKSYGIKAGLALGMSLMQSISSIALPILMRQMILILEDVDGVYPKETGYIYTFALFLTLLLQEISFDVYFVLCTLIENLVTADLTGLIMKKQFKLSSSAKAIYTNADIMNLIQTELGYAQFLFIIVSTPLPKILQIFAQCYLLYRLLGISFLISVAAIVLLSITSMYVAGTLDYWMTGMRKTTNKRISLLREFVQGVRLVKLQGNEEDFKSRILGHLDDFSKYLYSFFMVKSLSFALLYASIHIIAVLSFVGFSLLGGSLTASIIFPALVLLDISSPLAHLNDAVSLQTQAREPLEKVEEFLLADQNASSYSSSSSTSSTTQLSKHAIIVREAVIAYSSLADQFSLNVERLSLRAESFYGISGPVGSGKSTFLKMLLGELAPSKGEVVVNGSLAYCAQEPWIMQGSIQDNILFGSAFDSYRLTLAVESCGLKQDLISFSDGIKSMIGENGVNLSGGQKSRIALARAVYSDADVFLLDNPLAACDAKVARRIFTRLRDVLKKKTVLMVSNSSSILPKVDFLIEFDAGCLKSFAPISESGIDEIAEIETEVESDNEMDHVQQVRPVIEFVAKEEKEEGRVKNQVYAELLRNAGTLKITCLVAIFVTSIGFSIANPLWLRAWSLNTDASQNRSFLTTYIILGLLDSITTGLQFFVFFLGSSTIGRVYHLQAIEGLFKATMSFFDTNPAGRILNRLNADVIVSERAFSISFGLFGCGMVTMLASVSIICFTSPYMILLVLIIAVAAFNFASIFVPGVIEQNRLLPLASSKLYAYLNEVLEGSHTINSFNQSRVFAQRWNHKIDVFFGASFVKQILHFWMSQRSVFLGSTFVLAIGIFGCTAEKNSTTAAVIGLALSYCNSLTFSINQAITYSANIEARLNSIERLRHYGKNLPSEKVKGTLMLPPDQNWPERGDIEISNLTVSYDQRPDHLVIRDLSLTIKGGEKIGICGRTGCGKSTLVSCLFRLLELKSGCIKIDKLDISLLDLKTLRRGMQIIPQDPILFTGTVRTNLLVSLEMVGDAEVWEALERVGLKEYVSSLPEKLDAPIDASGSNMSFGQRQLMCLARAFLAKPVILVMDEATASIDQESDARVQSIIKQHFSKATIISIAHRLESIAQFDKIMVLNAGELVEFDAPSVLLSDPTSAFRQLVQAAGPETSEKIRLMSF